MGRNASKVAVLAGMMMLTGCSSLPLPPRDDPNSSGKFPFGDVSTFEEVRSAFKGYYRTYSEEALAKRVSAQKSSETGFYGAILGVLGGVAKEVGVAATGAVIGAGSGLYSDRYRLQVQAQSYEVSADAMLCMYLASQDMDSPRLSMFNLDGANQPGDLAARDIAIDGLLRVRDKLYKLQSKFELGQPDTNKLKDALKQPPAIASENAKFTANQNAAAANIPVVTPSMFAGTKTEQDAAAAARTAQLQTAAKAQFAADAEPVKARLQEYKSKIDQCVARTAG